MVHQVQLEVTTNGQGFYDVTSKVAQAVTASRVQIGLCNVFIRHTSASLLIQENADPLVRTDLQRWIEWIAPEQPSFGAWEHDAEGPDDMPAHARSALTHTSETIPVVGGKLGLGTWQAIYVWEHRRAPYRRQVLVTITGE
jgi:secondary thiamine-phosphate synthase enzyme